MGSSALPRYDYHLKRHRPNYRGRTMTADALHFAHLTDIHLSAREESWGTLSSLAEHLLAETINHLNTLPDLATSTVCLFVYLTQTGRGMQVEEYRFATGT